ncbi:MAG: AAA family ATPase [Mycobacteriales bacterium]
MDASGGGATEDEARRFARDFRAFLEWVHANASSGSANEVVALVAGYLGEAGRAESVVRRELPPFDHVNLQTALNHWLTLPGRRGDCRGVTTPPHWSGTSLTQLISGEGLPPLRIAAPELIDLPNGPGTTLACLTSALLLIDDHRGRYVVFVQGPDQHNNDLVVELAGLDVESAQAVFAELDVLRSRLNVYRGHVLDVAVNQMGGLELTFVVADAPPRDCVILPEAMLARLERHALSIAVHRDALLAAGQHLKRGLLLFGPPGTGKTHSTQYLIGQMSGYTRLIMTGRSLHAVGSVTGLARDLQPAVIVLEDVDLVASDRSFGPGTSTVLFDLLDAMDGAAPDADLMFVLTTNRADLLEPALAARPGRVDVAIEIALPDAEARRRLFDLYARAIPLDCSDADRDVMIERTDGVTASFLKELIRRATLEALQDDAELGAVRAEHVTRALDDLLDSAQTVTRTLLGIGADEIADAGPIDGPGYVFPSPAYRSTVRIRRGPTRY